MKYRRFFAAMLMMVLLSSVTALLPSLCLLVWAQMGDTLSWGRILLLLSLIAGAKGLTIALTVFRERYAKQFNERNFRAMLLDALNMDYDTIIGMGPANLMERICDSVNKIYAYMTGDYIQVWAGALTLAACLALTVSVQPWLAVLLLVMLGVNYFGYRMLNRELAVRSKVLSAEMSAGFGEILSYVQQVDYMKQAADHDRFLRLLSPAINRMYRSMANINVYAQSVSTGLQGLNELVQNFVLMVIVYGFATQDLGPYTLMMTSIILPLYYANLASIVGTKLKQTGFQVATAYQRELVAHREAEGGVPISTIATVGLDVDALLVAGKSIPFSAHGMLKRGDIAQICGPSGCGKSSFARALLKFRPIEGVCYNGIAIGEVEKRSLRARIEYLSQSTPIVRGTLGDNLFLGLDRTPEREARFLQEPMLRSIFATKSLDSEILEGGANLSGGEKQKIALARALCGGADVLILDEVCSNIDREAAQAIYACLARERGERITIMISHDPLPAGLVNVELNAPA